MYGLYLVLSHIKTKEMTYSLYNIKFIDVCQSPRNISTSWSILCIPSPSIDLPSSPLYNLDMNTQLHEHITQFLTLVKGNLASISTVSADGKPHSASVYFTFDDSLAIYFATRMGSRKYQNLLNNPSVAFLVSSINPPTTLQLEGVANLVTDSGDQRTYFTQILEKATKDHAIPPISQMMDSELAIIKITPNFARLGDFGVWRSEDTFQEVSFTK